jgi:hypothetical protein
MKIRSGEYDVIESGLVNAHGMSDVDFILSDSPPMTISARVRKADDGKASIELKIENSDKLIFEFSSPDSLNFGPAQPVEVGTLKGRKLFAMLRVNVMGDFSSFQTQYTFYLEGVTP